MMLETNRRSLITGLISLMAAPAIIKVSNLMPVKVMLTKETFANGLLLTPGQLLWRVNPDKIALWAYDGRKWIQVGEPE